MSPDKIKEIKTILSSKGYLLSYKKQEEEKIENELKEENNYEPFDESETETETDFNNSNNIEIDETKEDEQLSDKVLNLNKLINDLRAAYKELNDIDTDLNNSIKTIIDLLKQKKIECIESKTKLECLKNIVKNNKEFFVQIGELEVYEAKIEEAIKNIEKQKTEEQDLNSQLQKLEDEKKQIELREGRQIQQ